MAPAEHRRSDEDDRAIHGHERPLVGDQAAAHALGQLSDAIAGTDHNQERGNENHDDEALEVHLHALGSLTLSLLDMLGDRIVYAGVADLLLLKMRLLYGATMAMKKAEKTQSETSWTTRPMMVILTPVLSSLLTWVSLDDMAPPAAWMASAMMSQGMKTRG